MTEWKINPSSITKERINSFIGKPVIMPFWCDLCEKQVTEEIRNNQVDENLSKYKHLRSEEHRGKLFSLHDDYIRCKAEK